jgi:ferredoxin
MHYTVTIEETGESYRCSDQETLLNGMEKLGRRGIPVGCRGGGCGVCKVEVVSGSYTMRRMSREYVSEEDEANDRVLACRVRPSSDIVLRVIGLMKKNVCGDPANRLSGKTAQGTMASDHTGLP